MKTVILAGGFGTRFSEQTELKPKPMIEIGQFPIIVHIMKYYSKFGFNDFIICCGYKGYMIKEYFSNYYMHNSDITFDFSKQNEMTVHSNVAEPWRVTLVDTGLNTLTGGRIKRIEKYVKDETFMMTYGDGLSDVDIDALLDCHKKSKTIATLTAVQVSGRFGALAIGANNEICNFKEKPKDQNSWINGGFMVLEPKVFDYIKDDAAIFEGEPLEKLSCENQLSAYKHYGFWHCIDTQRDKNFIEQIWNSGEAPWKV
ncbi:MAG: glucose-1-phosphate cytidylyltransferase [Elusimicrobiota bacterium]|jgi:glucose-1-phosphate cytidylyltransferase|nr:glucose-1-phosphate cytidylyltransferase [Elusimicrobiota bacterium]